MLLLSFAPLQLPCHPVWEAKYCGGKKWKKKQDFEMFFRGVQPVAHGPHAPQNGYECGPAQNRYFT